MKPLSRARGIPPLTQAKTATAAWYRLVDAISKPDFIMIVAFCAIGLLTTLNVILRFPNLGSLIELYNQF
jgi:hypothetical protein